MSTRRALITQDWLLTLSRFPFGRGEITLPKGQLQEVGGLAKVVKPAVPVVHGDLVRRELQECEHLRARDESEPYLILEIQLD